MGQGLGVSGCGVWVCPSPDHLGISLEKLPRTLGSTAYMSAAGERISFKGYVTGIQSRAGLKLQIFCPCSSEVTIPKP